MEIERIWELVWKVVFFGKLRKAKKIKYAARLIEQGKPEKALDILKKMERKVPKYLGEMYFLTRGLASESLSLYHNAEVAYIAAVMLAPEPSPAYINLANLAKKRERFDEAYKWIKRLRSQSNVPSALLAKANKIEEELKKGR
jgi:tetratricopeptide (TPR) repeat protein